MQILETPRLLLREFVLNDVPALGKVLSDPITMRYYPHPYDEEGVRDWIDRNRWRYQEQGHGLWAMVLKTSGELIGDCGLIKQMVGGIDETEIGYHVRRDLWNQGFATEAARACRDHGFTHLPVDRLISLIRPENHPSCRVAEKNDMRVISEVMWHELLHYVYAIDRSEWEARGPQSVKN
jgi:[ribosomal protein S5]-alanine N-acetyltransferase